MGQRFGSAIHRWLVSSLPLWGGARWVWIGLVVAVLAALEGDRLRLQGAALGAPPGALDGMLALLQHKLWRFLVFTPLWLVACSPCWSEGGWDSLMVLRLGSRWCWWMWRVVAMLIALGLYLGVLMLGAAGPAFLTFPASLQWSPLARARPELFGIPPGALAVPPLMVLGISLILLTLGWLAIAALAMAVATASARSVPGFLVGFGLTLAGLVAWHMDWALPDFWGWPHRRWFLDLPPIAAPGPWRIQVALSIGYGMGGVALALLLSAHAAQRREFLGEEAGDGILRHARAVGRRMRWNLAALCGRWLWIGLGLFAGISVWLAREAASGAGSEAVPSIADLLVLAFGGPPAGRMEFGRFLFWLAPQVWFFLGTGEFAAGDLFHQGGIVLLRIGRRARWWADKALALLLGAWAYPLLGLGVAGGVATLLGVPPSLGWPMGAGGDSGIPAARWTGGQVLLTMWGVWGSSLAALGLWQQVLAIWTRRPTLAFATILLVLIGSWTIGSGLPPAVARWLPGAQGLLAWHHPLNPQGEGFSVLWTKVYNALSALGAFSAGQALVRRMDLLRPEDNG